MLTPCSKSVHSQVSATLFYVRTVTFVLSWICTDNTQASHQQAKWSQWYLFWNSDIPTSQSALKQSYTEETNCQKNDDKIKKPTLGSHSISLNYCNILAYFRITHNRFKAVLTVLSTLLKVTVNSITKCLNTATICNEMWQKIVYIFDQGRHF